MKSNPHLLFWFFIPFIILFGAIINDQVDIQLHDTYIVISRLSLSILFSLFLFLSGLGYFVFRKYDLNTTLTKIHIWFTLIGVLTLIIFTIGQCITDTNSLSGEFVEYKNIKYTVLFTVARLIGISLVAIGFFSYLINIITASFHLMFNSK